MLCERCKIREANIQYTEVINGVKNVHYYCSQCAKEMEFGPYAAFFDSEFPLGKLLSGLLGVGVEPEDEKANQIVCPTCKTTYGEFIQNSRFGCPDCYGVFDLLIEENIRKLQGSDTHKGKYPKFHYTRVGAEEKNAPETEKAQIVETPESEDPRERLRILDAKLHEAIAREEYEEAARYRDQIKELKEGIEQ